MASLAVLVLSLPFNPTPHLYPQTSGFCASSFSLLPLTPSAPVPSSDLASRLLSSWKERWSRISSQSPCPNHKQLPFSGAEEKESESAGLIHQDWL